MNRKVGFLIAACLVYAGASQAGAADKPTRPVFDADGVVHVPAFELPPSELSSKEAREFMKVRAKKPTELPTMEPDIAKSRKALEAMLAPQVALMLKTYPVDIVEKKIAGVPTRLVTAKNKSVDPNRVLINLHGGAFNTCWESCSTLESAPIASLSGYQVISVNYRMAPEATHPAGVEDVATVYREILKQHEAKHVGIYGCSAGGALTGQAAAWLPAHNLPQVGAIGIFGAGAVRFSAGDSAYIAGYIDGTFPAPARNGGIEPRHDTRLFRELGYVGPDHFSCAAPRCSEKVSADADHHRYARHGYEPGDLHEFAAHQGRTTLHFDRRRSHGALLFDVATAARVAGCVCGHREFLSREPALAWKVDGCQLTVDGQKRCRVYSCNGVVV